MSNCPQCSADLAVLRIIPGRGGAEYWTMRCIRCGGIHLDIVQAATPRRRFQYGLGGTRRSATLVLDRSRWQMRTA